MRKDFPTFNPLNNLHGKPIVYLDSACMSLKPKQVIDALQSYYQNPACAGRSHHALSSMMDERVQASRRSIAEFFSLKQQDVIFTKNGTEALNLVAHAFPFKKGDKVITLDKEHNSNLLPWQQLVKTKGIIHDIVATGKDSTFDMDAFRKKLRGTRMISFGHSSNLDGVSIPAQEIVREAHDAGAKVMFDGIQFAPHHALNLKALGADYYAVSFHKVLGPTGLGALLAQEDARAQLGSFIVGGGTVDDSTFTTANY